MPSYLGGKMYDKEQIVKDFSPLIKASIKKYFANHTSYEDAYQDGVVKILELLESYVGGGKVSLECYLKYQLKFFYMQKFAKRKRETEKTITKIYQTKDDETIEVLDLIVDESANTENEITENEMSEKVKEIVNTLPPKQKQVIEYKFYENLKNKEIAEKMKIKEDTVKEYYKIAKKKLKTKFLENDVNVL